VNKTKMANVLHSNTELAPITVALRTWVINTSVSLRLTQARRIGEGRKHAKGIPLAC